MVSSNIREYPPVFRAIKPIYGDNYKKGYVGFTYTQNNIVAKGIAYFTRWERLSDIRVSHALIVTGENSCIEADKTVHEASLERYFNDPHCCICFRKPANLTEPLADRIIHTLKPELGKKYDFLLIPAQAIAGSVLGKALNILTKGKFEAFLCKRLNQKHKWICSELVAYALNQQTEYSGIGILRDKHESISPQELFEDQRIFEPWK